MRRSSEFTETMRKGVRARTGTVAVHLNTDLTSGSPQVGFVVSKAVGNSVVRHAVQRKLRHVMRAQVDTLPEGSRVVVRALPSAARAPFMELNDDVVTALTSLRRRAVARR